MNDAFTDPLLVNVALSHMQFETIHAYKDGNGRLGRALIPVQMAMMVKVLRFCTCQRFSNYISHLIRDILWNVEEAM